ncbi:MAG: ABC transporter ATP-binding protein [Henriciella sp.]|uniref:ABC transporter ATP-binding protein n=1 Tax=Henriciella sp. TaxID=1968823 RepID=UPI0032ECFD1B
MTDLDLKYGPDLILQAKSVGKLYARRRGAIRRRLSQSARRAFFFMPPPKKKKLQSTEFWAVDDASFDLRRGEAIGIIGLNGSGKTTLLRMLAGQLLPDAGEITVNGSSASMIDLNAGFQASASGYENIFLRAAALGFSRAQTQDYLDEIIGFSEIEHALDAPMGTYSSGMKMRLAFSIMAIVSPDVLLIDEVLAVGDFRFRQKCLGKIREMRQRSAFVFVSHSMPDIRNFCDRVLVMHKGKVHFEGPPDEAIEVYEALDPETPPDSVGDRLASIMGPTIANDEVLEEVSHEWVDEKGHTVERVPFKSTMRLRVRFRSLITMRSLIVGVPVWNTNSQYLTGLSTQITSDKFDIQAGESVELMLEVDGGVMNPGVLKSMLTVLDGPEHVYRQQNPDLIIASTAHPTWGAVTVPHRWKLLRRDKHECKSREQESGTTS